MTSKPIAKRKRKAFKCGGNTPRTAKKPVLSLESLMSRVVTPPSMTAHCTLLGIEIRYPGETITLLTNQYQFDIECYYRIDQLKLPNDLLFEELESLEYVVADGRIFAGIRQLVDSQKLAEQMYDPKLPVYLSVTMMIYGDLIRKQERVIHLA